MRVDVNRELSRLLKCLHEVIRLIRRQEAGHILDADGVRAHIFNALCQADPILERICVTQCVREGNLCLCTFFLARINRCLQVSKVIQTVKDTKDVDTVCHRLLNEVLNDIVRIVVVAQNILAAEQHL